MGLPVARLTDMHVCPLLTGPVPHVGGPVLQTGCMTVLFNKLPAAQVGSLVTCVGPPDAVAMGSTTVLVGKLPAVRMLDPTVHGGQIIIGAPTVLIG